MNNHTDIFKASFLVDYHDGAPDFTAMVDQENDPLSRRLREMRHEANNAGKLTYILGFHRDNGAECFILEKRFVNWCYDEKRISMKPWIAVPGHVVVRSDVFYDSIDPKMLETLPQRFN